VSEQEEHDEGAADRAAKLAEERHELDAPTHDDILDQMVPSSGQAVFVT
jgi:hypothetical protein